MFRRLSSFLLATAIAASAFTSTATASFAVAPGGPMKPAPADMDFAPEPEPDPAPRFSEEVRQRLRAVLVKRRAKNVGTFRAYVARGIYPRNYITNGELNVWIDPDGRMCAAATMMFKSGARLLVRRQAKVNNYIRLADVTEGPLLDWILTSGLTHDEVIAIQAPMVGGPDMPQMPIDEIPEPEDWRVVQDRLLRERYDEVLAELDADPEAAIEEAIDALALHPDLVAKLLVATR